MKLVKNTNTDQEIKKVSDKEAEEAFKTILTWMGEDPSREGLIETPKRVVNAFKEYFKGSKDIDIFFEKTKFLDKESNKKDFGYSAKAGSAIIFDEGGVHRGSRPQFNDRMVLRYLYSSL